MYPVEPRTENLARGCRHRRRRGGAGHRLRAAADGRGAPGLLAAAPAAGREGSSQSVRLRSSSGSGRLRPWPQRMGSR
jgi:hypothetical protein